MNGWSVSIDYKGMSLMELKVRILARESVIDLGSVPKDDNRLKLLKAELARRQGK